MDLQTHEIVDIAKVQTSPHRNDSFYMLPATPYVIR